MGENLTTVMYYRSPIGLIEATAIDETLKGIRFTNPFKRIQPSFTDGILMELKKDLDGYFETGSASFDLKIDEGDFTDFRRDVYHSLADVESGELVTYKELADMSGHPGAARAVGSAMASNPYPIVIPCHRVIPSDGGVGQFSSGVHRKRWLIEHELSNLS
jgi:O-6-methylguanine DNA methyltransferase